MKPRNLRSISPALTQDVARTPLVLFSAGPNPDLSRCFPAPREQGEEGPGADFGGGAVPHERADSERGGLPCAAVAGLHFPGRLGGGRPRLRRGEDFSPLIFFFKFDCGFVFFSPCFSPRRKCLWICLGGVRANLRSLPQRRLSCAVRMREEWTGK